MIAMVTSLYVQTVDN